MVFNILVREDYNFVFRAEKILKQTFKIVKTGNCSRPSFRNVSGRIFPDGQAFRLGNKLLNLILYYPPSLSRRKVVSFYRAHTTSSALALKWQQMLQTLSRGPFLPPNSQKYFDIVDGRHRLEVIKQASSI